MSYRMDRSTDMSRSRPRARQRKESRGSSPRRPSPGPRNERKEFVPSKKNVTQVRDRSRSEDRSRGRKGSVPRATAPQIKSSVPRSTAVQKKRYRDSESPETTPKGRKSYSPPAKYRQPSPKYQQASPKYRQASPKYRQSSPKYRQPSPKKLSPVNRKPVKYSEESVPVTERPRYKRSPSPSRETVKYQRVATSNPDSAEYRRTIPVREEHKKYEFSSSDDKSSLKNIKRKLQERPNFRGADGVSYTRNDLKKLSIGIKRNIPGGGSAAMQQKPVNTENIVIVHRRGEGSRPIFDRDEIKAGQKERIRVSSVSPPPYKYRRFSQEMHERIVSMLDCNRGPRYDSPPPRYESDRQREFYRESENSKKYFSADNMKDRRYKDDSRYEYDRSPEYSRYDDSKNNEKYLDYRGKPGRERNTFQRNATNEYSDEKGRRGSRSAMPLSYHYSPDKSIGKMPDRRNQSAYESRRGSFRGDASDHDDFYENDFSLKISHPSDRNSNQKPWNYDPEYVPKGRAYFEHDNRESYARGSRGRGSFRGRVTLRGSSQYRGMRNPMGSRGGYVSRGSRPFRRGTGRGFRLEKV